MAKFDLAFIRERRQKLELTCAEMAEKLGMSASSYSRYERGIFEFSANILPLLAKSLKCDIKKFYR